MLKDGTLDSSTPSPSPSPTGVVVDVDVDVDVKQPRDDTNRVNTTDIMNYVDVDDDVDDVVDTRRRRKVQNQRQEEISIIKELYEQSMVMNACLDNIQELTHEVIAFQNYVLGSPQIQHTSLGVGVESNNNTKENDKEVMVSSSTHRNTTTHQIRNTNKDDDNDNNNNNNSNNSHSNNNKNKHQCQDPAKEEKSETGNNNELFFEQLTVLFTDILTKEGQAAAAAANDHAEGMMAKSLSLSLSKELDGTDVALARRLTTRTTLNTDTSNNSVDVNNIDTNTVDSDDKVTNDVEDGGRCLTELVRKIEMIDAILQEYYHSVLVNNDVYIYGIKIPMVQHLVFRAIYELRCLMVLSRLLHLHFRNPLTGPFPDENEEDVGWSIFVVSVAATIVVCYLVSDDLIFIQNVNEETKLCCLAFVTITFLLYRINFLETYYHFYFKKCDERIWNDLLVSTTTSNKANNNSTTTNGDGIGNGDGDDDDDDDGDGDGDDGETTTNNDNNNNDNRNHNNNSNTVVIEFDSDYGLDFLD